MDGPIETLDFAAHWPTIKRVVEVGQASTIYCSIASLNADGSPTITPIGTVFLRDDCTGYFFDQYTQALARNVAQNPHVCLMAINAGRWFWLKSLLFGRFASPPGVRLYGTMGARRPATSDELARIARRVNPSRWLKGSRALWSDFTHVRDLHFTVCRPVVYPVMMEGLWNESKGK